MRAGWIHERHLNRQGLSRIAGVDEAGRGPLAGPVVAAAVVLPKDFFARGVQDSKMLTEVERERLFDRIVRAAEFGIGVASVVEIDRLNILYASRLAMQRAVTALPGPAPDHVLIDGLPLGEMGFAYTAIVDGDARSVSIAAASIIAKVTRDRHMAELDAKYPGYGFLQHKGYTTPEHLESLRMLGFCPVHRKSFRPVREVLQLRLFGESTNLFARRRHSGTLTEV